MKMKMQSEKKKKPGQTKKGNSPPFFMSTYLAFGKYFFKESLTSAIPNKIKLIHILISVNKNKNWEHY
jgi:hypothetical protein